MSLAKEISKITGSPASVRIGTVTQVSPLLVTVQGSVFNDVGALSGVSVAAGDTVVLLGQSNSIGTDVTSWVCLGSVTPAEPGVLAIATLRQTIAQSLPNNVSTPIDFDTMDIDTVNGWIPAAPSRYFSQVPGRCVYQVSGGVSFAGNAAGVRTVQYALNGGAGMAGTGVSTPGNAATSQRMASRTSHIILNQDEFVEITAFQNSGAALNTAVTSVEQSTLEIRLVGRL